VAGAAFAKGFAEFGWGSGIGRCSRAARRTRTAMSTAPTIMPCCPTDVFTLEGEEDMVRFAKLAAPTREELSHILERVAARTLAMVRHRGLLEEGYLDGLASVQAEAIQKTLSLGAPPEEDPRKLAALDFSDPRPRCLGALPPTRSRRRSVRRPRCPFRGAPERLGGSRRPLSLALAVGAGAMDDDFVVHRDEALRKPEGANRAVLDLVDALAGSAAEVVVMALPRRLVPEGLVRQLHRPQLAAPGERLQGTVHGRDPQAGHQDGGGGQDLLSVDRSLRVLDDLLDGSALSSASLHGQKSINLTALLIVQYQCGPT
jgi:hypothetical protein